MVADLTIMMLVKGRDLHTLRWMWHANRIGLAYPILIGDGGDNPVSRRVLADPSLFPNLNYRYLRYNDATYRDYFEKAVDVCRKVETPYVFRADNDDFILPSGLERALSHLRGNPELIWSGAQLLQFTIHGPTKPAPHLVGDLYRLWMGSAVDAYQADAPLERMRAFAKLYKLQVYYAASTKERMLHTLERQLSLNPKNFDVNDIYTTFLSLFMGKHKVDPGSIIYMHQTHTSQIHSTLSDFPQRLYHNDLIGDFERLFADLATHGTPEQAAEIDALVRDFYARSLRTRLRDGSGVVRPGRLGGRLKSLSPVRRLRLAADVTSIKRRIAQAGTSPGHYAAQSADIAEVRRTLEGTEFLDFLRRVAPEALAAAPNA